MAVTNLSATAAALVDGNAMRVQYSLQAESHFNSAAISEKNVILSGDRKGRPACRVYGKATDATLNAIDRLAAVTTAAEQRSLIDTLRTAVRDRREASAKVFELTIAGKMEEAFAYSRNVAAKHRQTAIAAVGQLITINTDAMRAARDAERRHRRCHPPCCSWSAPSSACCWLSPSSAGSRSARSPSRCGA